MPQPANKNFPEIRLYNGYGNGRHMVLFGHILTRTIKPKNRYTANMLHNGLDMLKLFLVKPFSNVRVRLTWRHVVLETNTGKDGFFSFDWQAETELPEGWHAVEVAMLTPAGSVVNETKGEFFVPEKTQYGFISDIDDTVMVSHSTKLARRLREIFIKNPRSRKIFTDVQAHYQLLANAHTIPEKPNPFFYVSSSEWNLYGYLHDFFQFNGFPQGIFLLNKLKQWHQMFKTGKTHHEGKFPRMVQILNAFPEHKFVLLGDNSQADPSLYLSVVEKYGNQIAAVYIRNIRFNQEYKTMIMLKKIEEAGVHVCQYKTSKEAIQHSESIGLI